MNLAALDDVLDRNFSVFWLLFWLLFWLVFWLVVFKSIGFGS